MERIAVRAGEIRAELFERHLEQARLVGKLARRVDEVRKAVALQCEALKALRQQISAERQARRER